MNGSFNVSGTGSLNFPVKKLKGLNVNLTNMMYLSRDANLLYKQKNFTSTFQVNQSAGIIMGKISLTWLLAALLFITLLLMR
jgi:hypothetical protein